MSTIRDLSSQQLRLFADIVARLQGLGCDGDARTAVFSDIVRLMRGDFAASFVWEPGKRRFDRALSLNMDPDNIRRYSEWYQFRDPITFKLRARRRATLVEQVMPRAELERSEFYNDFLARDGLHHGINIFFFDQDRDLGDLRIWRARHHPEFGNRETALLDALGPYLCRALRRGARPERLTDREYEIALLVARGHTDRQIAGILRICFGTVRTHINSAMAKTGSANRAGLAAVVVRQS